MYTNILVVTVGMSGEKTSERRIGLIGQRVKEEKKQEKEEAVDQVRAISEFGLFLWKKTERERNTTRRSKNVVDLSCLTHRDSTNQDELCTFFSLCFIKPILLSY